MRAMLAVLLSALGSASPSYAAGAESLGARPAGMRAVCADLRGLEWKDRLDTALAVCVFTANSALPVDCGVSRVVDDGRGVRSMPARPEHLLTRIPFAFDSANTDTDAAASLMHLYAEMVRDPRHGPQEDRRTRLMRIEHSYHGAVADILRRAGPDFRSQAAEARRSAQMAADGYLAAAGSPIMGFDRAPAVDCPQYVDRLLSMVDPRIIRARRAAAANAASRARALAGIDARGREAAAAAVRARAAWDRPDRDLGSAIAQTAGAVAARERYLFDLRREFWPRIAANDFRVARAGYEALFIPQPDPPRDFGRWAAQGFPGLLGGERAARFERQARLRMDWLDAEGMNGTLAMQRGVMQSGIDRRQGLRQSNLGLLAYLEPAREHVDVGSRARRQAFMSEDRAAAFLRLRGHVNQAIDETTASADRWWRSLGRGETWAGAARAGADQVGQAGAAIGDGFNVAVTEGRRLMAERRRWDALTPAQQRAERLRQAAENERQLRAQIGAAGDYIVGLFREEYRRRERELRDHELRTAILDRTVVSDNPDALESALLETRERTTR